ncbi:hypothetical protein [Sorangium sp. So ce385]|uniref:hypothetical protein n=1 Tax=Sorangium sp. So ce385 TaxID=3133308 RepID=UPI003F5B555B
MFCNRDYFCSPNPEHDPDGYAAATAHCSPSVDEVPEGTYLIGACDGPEDCANGEYCVAMRNMLLNLQCSPDPGPPPFDCSCLGCWDEGDGLRSCTLCRSDADCGAGEVCSSRTVGLWRNDVRGCSPAE